MNSFSFSLRPPPGHPLQARGVARLEEKALVLSWTRETQFFPRQPETRERVLPIGEIARGEFHAGWWSDAFRLFVHRAEAVRDIPGRHPDGGLHLKVARDQREAARRVASMLALKISEHRLAQIRDPLES
jgi:hypothetical protein